MPDHEFVSRRFLICSRADPRSRSLPNVSASAAEGLFRHKVIRLLQHEGLLDEDRTRLFLSWHHSGFSLHDSVAVPAGHGRALEALAWYCLRCPVSPGSRRDASPLA